MKSIIFPLVVTLINVAAIFGLLYWQGVGAENYAQNIYPIISVVTTWLTGWFRLSLSDLFVFASLVGIVSLPFVPGVKVWRKVWYLSLFLSSVYIWFYLAWGMNYYRDNIYKRMEQPVQEFSAEELKELTTSFVEQLNLLYPQLDTTVEYKEDVVESLNSIAPEFKLSSVSEKSSKPMMFNRLSEKIGVSGYINPFFGEFHVRNSLKSVSNPFVFAHEASHKASVSSEDEANFIAFMACQQSNNLYVKFSGYYSVIWYLLSSLYNLVPEDEFVEVRDAINPGILKLYRDEVEYNSRLYSETLGKAQSAIYEYYLTKNNVKMGIKSYSQVVGLLLNFQNLMNIDENDKKSLN